ncbi:acetate--CoA ligase family protein [Actinoplanes sp. N902-109]|uniref:acetate--CoA ligase family protein n=1 Tax=Actinoplanes sp. (strain N902-109) TaxID=649831 RepID=UPI001E601968|nr:acetate--CoA ligase family protein [Actinoplanes sp. N902-109]
MAAAERTGYPVLVRPCSPVPGRPSAVRLGLTGPAAVREAFELLTAPGPPVEGVLVQRQHTAPVELSAGIRLIPPFGSVVQVQVQAGGGRTGRSLRLVPLTGYDAGRMWRDLGIRPWPGGRGKSSAVDTAALEDLLLRLSRLAEEHPEIADLELAPVLAGPGGVTVADAQVRLAPTGEPAATAGPG